MLKCLVIPNTIIIYYLSNIKRTVFGELGSLYDYFDLADYFLKVSHLVSLHEVQRQSAHSQIFTLGAVHFALSL